MHASLAAPAPPKKPDPTPTPDPTPPPPPAPTLTAERSEDGTGATLTWTAYTGADFEAYQAVVCKDSDYDGRSCSATVHKSGAIYGADSTGPHKVPGLEADTGYGVILQTWRTGGALKSHATLPGGPSITAPSNLTVISSDGDLTVSWDAVTGATGYDVESSTSLTGDSWQAAHSNTTSTSVTVADDANDRIERVRVRAASVGGPGPWAERSCGPSNDWLNVVIQDGPSRRNGASAQSAQGQSQLAAPATITRCATLTSQDDTAATHSVTLTSWTVGSNTYTIDDGATYDIKITSTNQWGDAEMLVPLIGPIPSVSNLGATSDTYGSRSLQRKRRQSASPRETTPAVTRCKA